MTDYDKYDDFHYSITINDYLNNIVIFSESRVFELFI